MDPWPARFLGCLHALGGYLEPLFFQFSSACPAICLRRNQRAREQACYGQVDFAIAKLRSSSGSRSSPDTRGKASLAATFHHGEQVARFMVVRESADPQDVLSAMEMAWGMPRPGAFFSIAGGVMNLKMHTVLAQVLTKGLAKAATVTDAWVVTAASTRA